MVSLTSKEERLLNDESPATKEVKLGTTIKKIQEGTGLDDDSVEERALKTVTRSGNGTAAGVGAGASVDVSIAHDALGLVEFPQVSTGTPDAAVAVVTAGITPTGFTIRVTNNAAAAQDVNYAWSRRGVV